jgi:hypothetical protein
VKFSTRSGLKIAFGAVLLFRVSGVTPALASVDTTPPWAFLVSPGPDAAVSEEQAIVGWAFDAESGIKSARVFVDGAAINTVAFPAGQKGWTPFFVLWETRAWGNGRHTIQLRIVNGADLSSDLERPICVANKTPDPVIPLTFAGTWSSQPSAAPRPDDPLLGMTVDPQNRLTLWAISRGRQGVFCSAQGVLNPDGSFDLLSREGSIRMTGQIAGDHQSVRATVTPPGLAPFSVTGGEWPDFNPLSRRWAGTFTGSAPAGNGQQIHMDLSIDPSGNATCQARVGSLQQSSTFCVTPDGRILLPGSAPDFPVGWLGELNGTIILAYRFWHPLYPYQFVVPLQPFQPAATPPAPPADTSPPSQPVGGAPVRFRAAP